MGCLPTDSLSELAAIEGRGHLSQVPAPFPVRRERAEQGNRWSLSDRLLSERCWQCCLPGMCYKDTPFFCNLLSCHRIEYSLTQLGSLCYTKKVACRDTTTIGANIILSSLLRLGKGRGERGQSCTSLECSHPLATRSVFLGRARAATQAASSEGQDAKRSGFDVAAWRAQSSGFLLSLSLPYV
jgi:hypothetical protein